MHVGHAIHPRACAPIRPRTSMAQGGIAHPPPAHKAAPFIHHPPTRPPTSSLPPCGRLRPKVQASSAWPQRGAGRNPSVEAPAVHCGLRRLSWHFFLGLAPWSCIRKLMKYACQGACGNLRPELRPQRGQRRLAGEELLQQPLQPQRLPLATGFDFTAWAMGVGAAAIF